MKLFIKVLLCSTISSAYLLYLSWKVKLQYKKKSEDLDMLNESADFVKYFFSISEKNEPCRVHLRTKYECGPNCSYKLLKTMVSLMDNAKYSIKMCIYHLSVYEISLALIRAKKRGIEVIVITDAGMQSMSGSKIDQLVAAGIRVKVLGNPSSYMHHKFFIVDADDENLAILSAGSVNYTMQGLTRNHEHVAFITSKRIIQKYNEEFKALLSI